MKKSSLMLTAALFATPAYALNVEIGGLRENGAPLPENFAFCIPDGQGKTKPGRNVNPQVRWSRGPVGTKSYALLVVDPDVPAKFDDANKDGKTIAADFPRQNFYHWVLIDIPATITAIRQEQDSNGYRPNGKPTGQTAYGISGKNDYASFMKGSFGGYDGPCPPWNDERIHHYHFRVYALDTTTLELPLEAAAVKTPPANSKQQPPDAQALKLSGNFTGKQVEAALAKHILDQGEAVGTFTNRQ